MITTEAANTTEKPVWGPWATIGLGVAILVVSGIIQAITMGIVVVVQLVPNLDNLRVFTDNIISELGLLISIATLVSSIICTCFIFGLIKLCNAATINDYLALRRIRVKTYLVLLATIVGFLALSYGFNVLFDRDNINQLMVNIYKTTGSPALFWITMVLFAPAFEEVFFRGFLFKGLSQSRIGIIGAIIITALGWAILHIQYDIYDIAAVFVLGIILGTARYKTGSLLGPFFIHVFNNLLAAIELALHVSGSII